MQIEYVQTEINEPGSQKEEIRHQYNKPTLLLITSSVSPTKGEFGETETKRTMELILKSHLNIKIKVGVIHLKWTLY